VTTQPVGAPAAGAVTCPLCGFGYVPGGDSCRDHGCPIAVGGCATRHCPRCGYTMPDEERSTAARLVRRLFRPRPRRAAGTLADLPAGATAVVERIEGEPALRARLTAQGLAPGIAVHVVQRTPTYVIEVGETSVALERRVAEVIVTHPGVSGGDGAPPGPESPPRKP
jgi:Fe2+ transport system protein FeoA